MNWGKSIVLCFILFAGFVGTMAYKMGSAKVDLVQKDYYQKEIDFQEHIDRVQNSKSYKKTEIMKFSEDAQELRVCFPTPVEKGKITFFRPSDKNLDFTINLKRDSVFSFSTADLVSGRWKVQAYWSYNRKNFFMEEDIFVQ